MKHNIFCPKCNKVYRVPERLSMVNCSCGGVATIHMGDLYAERLEKCSSCINYMGKERCKRVGLGCSRDFRALLNHPEASCPMDMWGPHTKK